MARGILKRGKRIFFALVFFKILMGAVLLHYHISSLHNKSDREMAVTETFSGVKNSVLLENTTKMKIQPNGPLNGENREQSRLLASSLHARDDTRPKSCRKREFSYLKNDENSKKFHKATSIAVMANSESERQILAAVSSIVNRTEEFFMNEILIFIYGNSSVPDSFEQFWTKLNQEKSLPYLVKYHKQRMTITEARNKAVKIISGKVVVFLHAQSECLIHWLEPLLANLLENERRIAVMGADETDWKTKKQIEHIPWHLVAVPEWSLVEVALHELDFKEQNRRNELDAFPDSSPIKTPLFLWPIFATWVQFYKDIGGYDTNLKATYPRTGEDNEFGIRTWLCGGEIFVVPCSKITQSFEPMSQNHTVIKSESDYNTILLSKYYKVDKNPMFNLWNYKKRDHISISTSNDAEKLLPQMKTCPEIKPFSWYVENLVPEMWNIAKLGAVGTVKVSGSGLCVDTYQGFEPRLYPCHGLGPQRFMYMKERLQFQSNLRKCIEVANDGVSIASMTYCDDNFILPSTQWEYKTETKFLVNKSVNKCLSVEKLEFASKLFVDECGKEGVLGQKWDLELL